MGDCFYGIENISSNCVKNIIFLENKKKRVREKENFTLFVINNLTISHDIEEGLFFDLSKVLYGLGLSKIPLKYEILY